MPTIKLAVDSDAETAYITLNENRITRTVEHNDCVLVDLDEFDVAVGVELLDLDAKIPYDELTTSYHVHAEVIEILRRIQPTINKYMFSSLSTAARSEDHEHADTGTLQPI